MLRGRGLALRGFDAGGDVGLVVEQGRVGRGGEGAGGRDVIVVVELGGEGRDGALDRGASGGVGFGAGAHSGGDLGHHALVGGRTDGCGVEARDAAAGGGGARHRRHGGRGAAAAGFGGEAPGRAGAGGGATHGSPGEPQEAVIDGDGAGLEVAQEAAGLRPADAERKAGDDDEGDAEGEGGERERGAEVEGDEGEGGAERGVAEEASEAVFVRPAGRGDVARGEGGGGDEGDGNGDGAADRAGLAGMGDEAQAPDRKRERDAVGGPAQRAVERIGNRGADQAERVAGRGIGGAEEAGVVGGISPDQRRGEGREQEKDQAEQFGAAAAQGLLGVALHQGGAALGLAAGCHLRPSFR